MKQFRQTVACIDLAAIKSNVSYIRARVPMGARVMAVVKADAYGHGAIEVALAALRSGADCLGVAIPEEGAQLREAGFVAPILVLGGISQEGAEAVAAYGLAQTVFDLDTVNWLADAAKQSGKTVDVHIKVDTGMGRIGVRDSDALNTLVQAVSQSPYLNLAGIFTHFADAGIADLSYTDMQAKRFLALAEPIKKAHPAVLLHACNSAAALRCPSFAMDMVRVGFALYAKPDIAGDAAEGIKCAMRFETRAVCVKEIDAGESVGYGRAFVARRKTRVMTLPVGYADGYHRAIGGRGFALVRGQRAPVIGRVCMDQAMLDVTDVDGAQVGDAVVLMGDQQGDCISPLEFGAWCGMIDYEALLSPTSRVQRVYTS